MTELDVAYSVGIFMQKAYSFFGGSIYSEDFKEIKRIAKAVVEKEFLNSISFSYCPTYYLLYGSANSRISSRIFYTLKEMNITVVRDKEHLYLSWKGNELGRNFLKRYN